MAVSISAHIPSGSIDVIDVSDPRNLRLRLKEDADTKFVGYFHFRISGARGAPCRFRLANAGAEISGRLDGRDDYEDEWTGTGPHVSYDRRNWFRVPGRMIDGEYVFEHTPEHDVCYYAKWAPYTREREMDFVALIAQSPLVRVETIAITTRGMPLDLLTIGTPAPQRRVCWIIARQHPSETMGGYFLEGFLERLLDPADPVARSLLDRAVFYVVPNMNPDGSHLGHTRANGAGMNLNREWISPSAERSPEVFHVRALMEISGVDFCMDCHGDEELRCNFLGGPLEIPSRSERLAGLFRHFELAWSAASPEYELGHPYPGGAPAKADLSMAWNWIAERFNCLSVLLEQPFKDTSWYQDNLRGWCPERAHAFGSSLVVALRQTVDQLRS